MSEVENRLRYLVRCPGLPLAVYREVAAHLRQVAGVETGLIPENSQQFDYNQSQVGGLWIEYTQGADQKRGERVAQILKYYSDRYGSWSATSIAQD